MRDYLDLGPTPANESCEQLGPNYDEVKARAECRAFIGQLRRVFGEPPIGAGFKITSNAHDFGTYHEVAVWYDEDSVEACRYAFHIEGNTPATWDADARRELGL